MRTDSDHLGELDRASAGGPRWFAVHSLPHREAGAQQQLENQGFHTFLPRCLKARRHACSGQESTDETLPLSRPRPRRGLDALTDRSSNIEPAAVPGFERASDQLEDGMAGDAFLGVADEAGDPPAGPSPGAARKSSDAALPLSHPANHSEVATKRPR